MKDSALRSHRKPAKPEMYQLIVVVHFNQVISYLRLIENRLIVNIPSSLSPVHNSNNKKNESDDLERTLSQLTSGHREICLLPNLSGTNCN